MSGDKEKKRATRCRVKASEGSVMRQQTATVCGLGFGTQGGLLTGSLKLRLKQESSRPG